MKQAFAILAFTVISTGISTAAPAKEVKVEGRVVVNSCGYYSNRAADFRVLYQNDLLPEGATVALRAGLGGRESTGNDEQTGKPLYRAFDWEFARITPMKAAERGLWELSFSQTLEERGSPRSFSFLNFVFLVQLADGRKFIDDGAGFHPGNYQVKLETDGCAGGGDLPATHPFKVQRHEIFVWQ